MSADERRQDEPLFPCVAAMGNNHHHKAKKTPPTALHYKTKVYQHQRKKKTEEKTPKTIGRNAGQASPQRNET